MYNYLIKNLKEINIQKNIFDYTVYLKGLVVYISC